jgi:hypothetical protein
MIDQTLLSEIVGYAIIQVQNIRFALVLANDDCTYSCRAQQVFDLVQIDLPSLPIIILAPRIQGYSRAYSTFNIDKILPSIDVNEIVWSKYPAKRRSLTAEVPF